MSNTVTRPETSSIVLNDSGIELTKWFGLLFMLLDHINKYLFNYSIVGFYELGRVAMPLFGLVLAYNLSRPSLLQSQNKMLSIATKLLIFGLIASPAYMTLGGVIYGWWPLNILFTLSLATTIIWSLHYKAMQYWWMLAPLFFLFGGAIVEFWWPAISLIIFSWAYFKTGIKVLLIGVFLSFCGLSYINDNYFAFAAIPIFFLLQLLPCTVTRRKHVFYFAYVLQFYVYIILRIPMSEAGYIFLI